MRCLTNAECQDWLVAKGVEAHNVFCSSVAKPIQQTAAFEMPNDAGHLTAFSLQFAERSGIDSGLLWILNTDIFPSCGNLDLFHGYRRSLGESRALYEAPGQVFEPRESQQLASILNLALLFFGDVVIVDSDGRMSISFSHDEYVAVVARDSDRLDAIRSSFADFGLRRHW